MKKIYITLFVLVLGGVFSVNAQDIITLKDGSTIQAKVLEIHPLEIRYKRFDNQNGPIIIIYATNVSSIKYPNGVVDVINTASTGAVQQNIQMGAGGAQTTGGAQTPGSVLPAQLQTILNSMPPITIAGNSLKFQFNGDKWTALLNGDNFSTGTIGTENTATGSILTLKQTHIWPGAAAKTAGRVASLVPGGAAVGGALNTASSVAGAAGIAPGAVEAPGQAIILEYIAGPSPKLLFVRSQSVSSSSSNANASQDLPKNHIAPALVSGVLIPDGWKANYGTVSDVNLNFNEGTLTMEAYIGNGVSDSRFAGIKIYNSEIMMHQKSGIRLKVIGDGDTWCLVAATSKPVYVYSKYDRVNFSTKKGETVQVDIPFSKLKLGRYEVFSIGIEKAPNTKVGNYTIQISDIELY